MAARVLLLGILFTEVLEPVCAAGARGPANNFNGKNGSKGDIFDPGLGKYSGSSLRIGAVGNSVLGKRGVTLSCSASSNSDVSWIYNGQPAPPCGIAICDVQKNRLLHFPKKQNLKLIQKEKGWNSTDPRIREKHEYRCIEKNSIGSWRSSPTYLQIADLAHTFRKSPIDLVVYEGEIARFECLIDSIPETPNISWQHNGELLRIDRKNTKYSLVPPGVLYIISTEQSDAGSYRCIATNDFIKKTKKSNDANLTVSSRPENENFKIPASLFSQVSYNHSLKRGENLSLVCAASGYPSPFITWTFVPNYPDGVNAVQSRILFNSTTGISILALKNVSISDAGTYLCSTKNAVSGGIETQNITVEVAVPPTFIKKPLNHICPNGRTARFECQAKGIPTPQIYWLKDAENISVNGRLTTYMKENNTMQLAVSATVPSDSGIYQCIAVNSAGEIWAAGRLQVNASRNSPVAPESLRCDAPSPVKIFISWSPPKSSSSTNITAYTVHYSPEEGGQEEVKPEPGNSTSVEVTKLLEPYTNYSFYIRVWNIYGASDQSATIICATPPSVPKTALKVHLEVLSSTKLDVKWQPLTKKEARGVIVEYKIQCKLHAHPLKDIIIPATFDHYILPNLLPGAQYDLRVLARTEQGWPNISESLGWNHVIMPPVDKDELGIRDVIDIQIIILNASNLRMEWKSKNGNSDYMRIKFESWKVYTKDINGVELSTVLLPKNSSDYLFNNLEPNISYTLGLCIVNESQSDDCISKTIKSIQHDSENIPTALEAIALNATSIQISWIMVNKTAKSTFKICYQPINGYYPEVLKCIIKNDTKAKIEDLKPFTLYQFKVRIFENDSIESSQFSNNIECRTPEYVPGPPEEVRKGVNLGQRLRINWKEPNETNGLIRNYSVSYTEDLSNPILWKTIIVPGNKTFLILNDLMYEKTYYVMVKAATSIGYGRSSVLLTVKIMGDTFKSSTSSDKQQPSEKSEQDQSLGIILGVGISIGFIAISLCSIYCRKKWEHSRAIRETAQPLKKRNFKRNGNPCCFDDSSTSAGQSANNTININEIELAVIRPATPTTANSRADAKVRLPNGIDGCPNEPLLIAWKINEETNDLHITENPQYKQKDSLLSSRQSVSEADLDTTELTMIDCTLASVDTSLNNNLGCSTSSPRKVVPATIPVLEPNG